MNKDFFSSFLCLLFSIYFCVESYHFGMGERGTPGPGFFPFFAGLLFGIISIFVMVRALGAQSSRATEFPTESRPVEHLHWRIIVQIMIGMLGYALLLKKLGFILCTFFLIGFFVHVVARQRWLISLIVALSVTIGSHLIFNIFLNAQLPTGILGFLGR